MLGSNPHAASRAADTIVKVPWKVKGDCATTFLSPRGLCVWSALLAAAFWYNSMVRVRIKTVNHDLNNNNNNNLNNTTVCEVLLLLHAS